MGYYRSWRYRGSYSPSKYSVLVGLFGEAVGTIRNTFLRLDEDAQDQLLSDYGSIYGDSAERYARKTLPKWRSGETKLSGQTMERLIELVPPYLSAKERFSILQSVLKLHRPSGVSRHIKINVQDPAQGFNELNQALSGMNHDDPLAHLPEKVMKAASWLYDDDITSARAMLAEAERHENEQIRAKATREIELLRKTISSGQVKAASYSVEMPAGRLTVVAYTPSKCYVATACFGQEAWQTAVLRKWRDERLMQSEAGRNFVVWYYNHGEHLAGITSRSRPLKYVAKAMIGGFANAINWSTYGKKKQPSSS